MYNFLQNYKIAKCDIAFHLFFHLSLFQIEQLENKDIDTCPLKYRYRPFDGECALISLSF